MKDRNIDEAKERIANVDGDPFTLADYMIDYGFPASTLLAGVLIGAVFTGQLSPSFYKNVDIYRPFLEAVFALTAAGCFVAWVLGPATTLEISMGIFGGVVVITIGLLIFL